MTPLEIKFELKKRGFSQADVGRACNPPVTRNTVFYVIHGNTSRNVQTTISNILGKPINKIWTEKK
jgi:lambda repressor-like predicted transcriptional regulator